MKKNVLNKLGQLNVAGDVTDQLIQILSLSDEQFDAIYENFKVEIEKSFDSDLTRKNILEQVKMSPAIDVEAEKKAVEEMLKELDEEDISENKKDIIKILFKHSVKAVEDIVENPRETVTVKVQKINENAVIPTYAHPTDAGADIYAIEDVTLKPHSTQILPTGLKVEIPTGYMINIVPRSGLSAKTTLRLANCIGVIDSEYRGELGMIIENTGNLSVTIHKGDRIGQMWIMPVPMIKWVEVDELSKTTRGTGGYGSTGQ